MLLVCVGSGAWLALGCLQPCQGKAKEDGEVHVAQAEPWLWGDGKGKRPILWVWTGFKMKVWFSSNCVLREAVS